MKKDEKNKNDEYNAELRLARVVRHLENSEVLHDCYDVEDEGVEELLKDYGVCEDFSASEKDVLRQCLFDMAFYEEAREAARWARNETDPVLLFEHLTKGSPLSYLDSANIKRLEPFFYQAYTELGYYNYELEPFKDLITTLSGDYAPSNIFAPNYESLVSNHKIMLDVNEFIQTKAKNMIFIYGEYDPWGSSAVDLKDNTNCLKMVKEKGSHKTRIKHFNEADKKLIYSKLEEWMDYEIPN